MKDEHSSRAKIFPLMLESSLSTCTSGPVAIVEMKKTEKNLPTSITGLGSGRYWGEIMSKKETSR